MKDDSEISNFCWHWQTFGQFHSLKVNHFLKYLSVSTLFVLTPLITFDYHSVYGRWLYCGLPPNYGAVIHPRFTFTFNKLALQVTASITRVDLSLFTTHCLHFRLFRAGSVAVCMAHCSSVNTKTFESFFFRTSRDHCLKDDNR